MHTVYLLLGSNKGNRKRFLALARQLIQQHAGFIIQSSPVFVTEPWGNDNQPKYLNQALKVNTHETPFRLLKTLKRIEKVLGRVNKHHYSARTIDIDILFYDNTLLKAKNLIIPHPRLHLRNFTLVPLMELDKSYTHPVLQKSIEQLMKECEDTLKVSIFTR